jgi:hypothetical protein
VAQRRSIRAELTLPVRSNACKDSFLPWFYLFEGLGINSQGRQRKASQIAGDSAVQVVGPPS